MDLSLFDYHLPNELIAQEPSKKRGESRLMVYDRKNDSIEHTVFKYLNDFLPEDSDLFRNKVTVLKARIFGERKTGGGVECLLLNPAEDANTWWCLLKPGKKTFQAGNFYSKNNYEAVVIDQNDEGLYKIVFKTYNNETIYELANRLGKMPLPPYINRDKTDPRDAIDSKRYQTVYADKEKPYAAAAPTAGLHFTNKMLDELKSKGHDIYDLTLNVGIGTFQPIHVDQIEDHKIHEESYEVERETLQAILGNNGRKKIAIGTTSFRTIESIAQKFDRLSFNESMPMGTEVLNASTDLYIYPPADILAVDCLITNFHLPKSSLLCLVSAFLAPNDTAGINILKKLYKEAIEKYYKFYSYGDALLIK